MQIKSRPIPFTAGMMSAILDGDKTETRRVIKIKSNGIDISQEISGAFRNENTFTDGYFTFTRKNNPDLWLRKCPYGRPGDLLWCRETWSIAPEYNIIYKAGGFITASDLAIPYWNKILAKKDYSWHPSMFMPQVFSRLTLIVKDIIPEHLQDITEDGARAEGFSPFYFGGYENETFNKMKSGDGLTVKHKYGPCLSNFIRYWDKINAKRGYTWESNPMVWVIKFEVIHDG